MPAFSHESAPFADCGERAQEVLKKQAHLQISAMHRPLGEPSDASSLQHTGWETRKANLTPPHRHSNNLIQRNIGCDDSY